MRDARAQPRRTLGLLRLRPEPLLERALLAQRGWVRRRARAVRAWEAAVVLREHAVSVAIEHEEGGYGVEREVHRASGRGKRGTEGRGRDGMKNEDGRRHVCRLAIDHHLDSLVGSSRSLTILACVSISF